MSNDNATLRACREALAAMEQDRRENEPTDPSFEDCALQGAQYLDNFIVNLGIPRPDSQPIENSMVAIRCIVSQHRAFRNAAPGTLRGWRTLLDMCEAAMLGGADVPRPFYFIGSVTPVDEWSHEIVSLRWEPPCIDDEGDYIEGEWCYETRPTEEYTLNGKPDYSATERIWQAAQAAQLARHDFALAMLAALADAMGVTGGWEVSDDGIMCYRYRCTVCGAVWTLGESDRPGPCDFCGAPLEYTGQKYRLAPHTSPDTPPADMGVTVPTAGSGEGATDEV